MNASSRSTRIQILAALTLAISAFCGKAEAQMSNSDIDAVSKALGNKPAMKDGGHESIIGYYATQLFRGSDWPISEEDVRRSHEGKIPADRDTDKDGIPDLDDDDLDGDGKPNDLDDDLDGDGVPNSDDEHPYDSEQHVWDPNSGNPDDGNDPMNPFENEPMHFGNGLYGYRDAFILATEDGYLVELEVNGYFDVLVVKSMDEAMIVVDVLAD